MQQVSVSIAAAALLAVASFHAPEASAADATRDYVSHGVANCQPALPAFDGLIRKRPKAMANEGSSNAFISCDFEGAPNVFGRVIGVSIYLINRNAAAVTASCTLVSGFGDTVFAPMITKTQALAPGLQTRLHWEPGDNGGQNFTAPAVSCNINPGVELTGTQLLKLEYIGD